MKSAPLNGKAVVAYLGLAALLIAVVGASWWLKPANKPQKTMGLPLFKYRFDGASPGDPPVQQLVIAAGTMRTRLRLLAKNRKPAMLKLLDPQSSETASLASMLKRLPSTPPVRMSADGLAFRWLPRASRTADYSATGSVTLHHKGAEIKSDASTAYKEGEGRDLALAISLNQGYLHSIVYLSGRVYLYQENEKAPGKHDLQVYHRYRFLTSDPAAKRFPMTRNAAVLLGPIRPIGFPESIPKQVGASPLHTPPLSAKPPR